MASNYFFFGLLLVSQILALVSINNRNFTIISFSPPKGSNGPIPNGRWILSALAPGVNVSGGIVYLNVPTRGQYYQMHPFSLQVDKFQSQGAIGSICAYRDDRIPGSHSYGAVGLEFTLPLGVVPKAAVDWARTFKNQTINVVFYDFDFNPWSDYEDGAGYIMYSLILGCAFLSNVILSGYRLTMWTWYKGGIDLTLGFLCLTLELLQNFGRVLQFIFWGLHNNFRIPFIDVLITIPWCITGITSIIITFFWLDLTSDPLYHGSFMGIMKIPALIFAVGMIIGEVACDIVRTTSASDDYINQVIFFYGAFVLFIATINFVAAYRILKPFNKTVDTKEKVKKIIYRIILSGIAQILSVFFVFIFLYPPTVFTPQARYSLNFLLYTFYFLQSVLLITIFQVPEKLKTSSSSHKEGSTSSKTKDNTSSVTPSSATPSNAAQ